jgi:hypothetical protein
VNRLIIDRVSKSGGIVVYMYVVMDVIISPSLKSVVVVVVVEKLSKISDDDVTVGGINEL